MNHFKCILDRTSRCELRRLQSSLSVSNSKIEIPSRIKRDPTDILHALENTIPKDSSMHIMKNYIYHDDPYLLPMKKLDYRIYALSYESGKKTANWIHKEHSDLFPKHLSNPEIEAFKPFPKYTDKNQVSEEILLHAISQCMISDALHIYKLLDTNVSNGTKQALLELLCFYNNKRCVINNLFFEHWFSSSKENYIWQYKLEINELYNFLITQDDLTAAAAHNIMICGLTKYSRLDEAWLLYQKCKEKDIPLNLTTWNYVIILFEKIFNDKKKIKIDYLYDILTSMNQKKIKPNIQTLNSILKIITALNIENFRDIIKYLLLEFKNMNIKFSLATYYYIIRGFINYDDSSYNNFIEILRKIKNKRFTIQDPMDNKFFKYTMYLASKYNDKEAGNMIHELLLTGDNYKFISTSIIESDYYNTYILLLLSTSTVDEFFESYEKLVPNEYIPTKQLLINIINKLKSYEPHVLKKHIPRLWSDINTYCRIDLSIKLILIHLMKMNILSVDSSLRTIFINAAWDCWNEIKKEIMTKGKTNNIIGTTTIANIAIILLHGDFVKESIEVLTYINKSDLFISVMNENQINELFDKYISKQCIKGCLLVLDYSVNSGFSNINQMVMKLHSLPEFTNVDRDKLINLVGEEVLHILDTEQLN
ncbi:protein PTCD3 homolog, mitochondrial [Apis dorsata]|uniref:protein PTCD3 homolog, mitochondrial n=1 Tax=Apis dorsata TaxID=7462 RepID=UPI0012934D5A|nr:protein PTCD3 homolog, mitochondrial [Apis dorsata]